jgi:hypothetical protein
VKLSNFSAIWRAFGALMFLWEPKGQEGKASWVPFTVNSLSSAPSFLICPEKIYSPTALSWSPTSSTSGYLIDYCTAGLGYFICKKDWIDIIILSPRVGGGVNCNRRIKCCTATDFTKNASKKPASSCKTDMVAKKIYTKISLLSIFGNG